MSTRLVPLTIAVAALLPLLAPERADAHVNRVSASLYRTDRPAPTRAVLMFHGSISCNSADTVQYRWVRSDGTTLPLQTHTFRAPGEKRTYHEWTLEHSYRGWVRLETTSPNAAHDVMGFDVRVERPRVLTAELHATRAVYEGRAPQTVELHGTIRTNGPCNVNYSFVRSDGASGPVSNLLFDGPGERPVSTTWTLGRSCEAWVSIRISTPGLFSSARAPFRVRITP